jgi:hypothetical protein
MIYEFVHGWTEPIQMQLLRKGIPEDLTGKTVTIIAVDKDGNAPITGTVTVVDAVNGIVKLSPASGDLNATKSPYRVWWKLSQSGQDSFVPSGEPDTWIIHPLE